MTETEVTLKSGTVTGFSKGFLQVNVSRDDSLETEELKGFTMVGFYHVAKEEYA